MDMAEIPLTKGDIAIVDAHLAHIVDCYKWHSHIGYAKRKEAPGEGASKKHRATIHMHRLLWEHVNGPIPAKMYIDHINGNTLDNRLANLRCVTHRQNSSNQIGHREKKFTSSYIGVSYKAEKRKWVAQIHLNGKLHHLGYFNTEFEASEAYQEALSKQKNNL